MVPNCKLINVQINKVHNTDSAPVFTKQSTILCNVKCRKYNGILAISVDLYRVETMTVNATKSVNTNIRRQRAIQSFSFENLTIL